MYLQFEKYSDKSFVVRGDCIDTIDSRKKVLDKLKGKCIFNVKLKGGKGLLVPYSEENEKILNSLSSETDSESLDSRYIKSRNDKPRVEKTGGETYRKDKINEKTTDSGESKIVKYKRNSETDSDESEKEEYRDSKYKRDSKDSNYKRDSDKRGSARDSKYKRDSDTDSDESKSRKKSSSSSKSRSRKTSRSSSDSETDYSSEDEKIQKTIRGGVDYKSERQELSTFIDSDVEDVVTISRRLRYFKKYIDSLKNRIERLESKNKILNEDLKSRQ